LKRLAVFTSARSDFGLLRPIIAKASACAEVHVFVGGAHFSASRGGSIREVEEFAANYDLRLVPVDFMQDGESSEAHVKSIALGQSIVAHEFSGKKYDAMVLLGDRWELFAASLPALLFGIPIAHISGGEVTEGVIDDSVRHAHSKLAHLHFVATEAYAENLSRMGEEDWRITVSGECGLDSIHAGDVASREEVWKRFDIDIAKPNILVTFHPATLDQELAVERQVEGLISALERLPDIPMVITAPGMEQGADLIQKRLLEFADAKSNVRFVPHLGSRCYLAVLQAAAAVVGNSSSGLVEAASFGVPTINIGNRQRNRLSAESVLHVGYGSNDIEAAIRKALSLGFQSFSKTCINPYDPYRDGRNCERILHALLVALETQPRASLLGKRFALDVHQGEWNTFLKDFR
jgi:UDP-hydrolysing UDP-N-acetyl-D-glucosamine 2-epimerase